MYRIHSGLVVAIALVIPAIASSVPWYCMDRMPASGLYAYPHIELINSESAYYCIDNQNRLPSPELTRTAMGFTGLTYMWFDFESTSPLEEATHSRDAFYHSTDPAGLAGYVRTAGRRTALLYWQSDQRYAFPQLKTSISSYAIERKRSDEQSWTEIATGIQSLTYPDTAIAASFSYAYRIFSLDSKGRRLPFSWEFTPTVLTAAGRRCWVESIGFREPQISQDPQTFAATFHVENFTNGDTFAVYLYYPHWVNGQQVIWNQVSNLTPDYNSDRIIVPSTSISQQNVKDAGFIGYLLIVNGKCYPENVDYTTLENVRQIYGCSYNNRVIAGGWGHYVMNPTSSEWRTALVNHISQRSAQGFYGSWLDNAFPGLNNHNQDWFLHWLPWEYTTDEAFQSGMISLLQNIRTSVGGAPLFVNTAAIPYRLPGGSLDAYYQHADISVAHEINNETGNKWLYFASILQRAANMTDVLVASQAVHYGDPESRLNDLATFLNVNPNAYIEMNPNNAHQMCFEYTPLGSPPANEIRLRYYPELQNFLGNPLPGSAHDYSAFISVNSDQLDCDPAYQIQYRKFERGIVIQNIRPNPMQHVVPLNFANYGLPATMWKVSTSPETEEAFQGARLTTTQVSTGYELMGSYPVFLLYSPIQYPEIANAAREAVIADGTTINTIRVEVTTPSVAVNTITLYDADPASNLQSGRLGIVLYDDGVHGGDAIPADRIFTGRFSEPLPWSVQAGTYTLDAWVRATSGLIDFTTVDVTVETAALRYVNKSADTNLLYPGRQPRNATPVDFDNDGNTDLIITFANWETRAYRSARYTFDGVPEFEDLSGSRFPGNSGPAAGTTGIICADYNNDGFIDFFAPNPNGARLYFNNGQAFENHSTISNITTLAANAVGGAWGDYNRDGLVDLFVQYGSNDSPEGHPGKLLMNSPQGGLFTAVAGMNTNLLSNSAIWADFNADGYVDLLLAGAGNGTAGGNTVYWVNQGDGTFVNEASSRIPQIAQDTYLKGHTCAAAGDLNSDGYLDVAFVGSLYYGYLENDGQGNFGVRSFARDPSGETPLDISVYDFDLDGYQDIAFSGGSTTTRVHLMANREDSNGQRAFRDVSSEIGLSAGAAFQGMAICDFDRDGVVDIYTGRAYNESNKEFYFKGTRGQGLPANHWIAVRVNSPHGANSSTGLGAIVRVSSDTDPTIHQVQVVDGGSGRGSQSDRILVFGLGDYSGLVRVSVRLANGSGTTLPNGSCAVDQVVTLTDNSPVIDNSSIWSSMIYNFQTGITDWQFYWETFNVSLPYYDKVKFGTITSGCRPGPSELTYTTPNVTFTQTSLGNGKWSHLAVWTAAFCEAKCSIPFTVESLNANVEPTKSNVHYFNMPSCLQQ